MSTPSCRGQALYSLALPAAFHCAGASLRGRCLADGTDFDSCHAVVAATVVRKGEGPFCLDGADIELCFAQRAV